MNKHIWRYQIITNLQCNNRCYFCYQTYKPDVGRDKILSLERLKATLDLVGKQKRATLMGGESTLLDNLEEYISIANDYADITCLVTNGKLLTEAKLLKYVNNGLQELAISINSIDNYKELKDLIYLADSIVPNLRINLPRCYETSNEKLYELLIQILNDGFGCVVCEDLMGRYGEPHEEVFKNWVDLEVVNKEFNFITYKFKNLNTQFGLFSYYEGYDYTDVIISPLGNFCSWKKYCEKIGNFALS